VISRRTPDGDDVTPVAGWNELVGWGSGRVLRRLGGDGGRDIRLVELEGRRAVARLGGYSEVEIDWELDLLEHLAEVGVGVPRIVPALDGRRRAGRLVVVEEVVGHAPTSTEDWIAVGSALRWLHRMTDDWPQRPGRLSSIDLLHVDRADGIDLREVPDEVTEICRAAWRRVDGMPTAVIQGDPHISNIRITPMGPVFLDWSAARVDIPDLDLAELPDEACPIHGKRRWLASQAAAAWTAACTWNTDLEHARRNLDRIDWP
jgi:Ser/Thr protein kinase RdoA (MazF antagonist)